MLPASRIRTSLVLRCGSKENSGSKKINFKYFALATDQFNGRQYNLNFT